MSSNECVSRSSVDSQKYDPKYKSTDIKDLLASNSIGGDDSSLLELYTRDRTIADFRTDDNTLTNRCFDYDPSNDEPELLRRHAIDNEKNEGSPFVLICCMILFMIFLFFLAICIVIYYRWNIAL